MSSLTDLEKVPLLKICKDIKDLKKVYDENADCFHDTVCKQYTIGTDERITFDNFMIVVNKLNDIIDDLDANARLVNNHFLK